MTVYFQVPFLPKMSCRSAMVFPFLMDMIAYKVVRRLFEGCSKMIQRYMYNHRTTFVSLSNHIETCQVARTCTIQPHG